MKEITSYNRAVQYLNKVFKMVNDEYFENELEMPTITIQSTVGAYGHVTTSKVWKTDAGNASYELNIGADYLNRPIENIVATLIHEGCHLYAMQNKIKDTSNRGCYHNRRFKKLAEERGLIISQHPVYGWTITQPSEKTLDFCEKNELREVLINRGVVYQGNENGNKGKGGSGNPKPIAKKGNSIKWICPNCGAIIRSTRNVNVICGDCNVPFAKAN